MYRRLLLAGLVAQALAVAPAHGAVRELGQTELRQSVQSGKSLSLQKVLSSIPSSVDGEPVDVRAFDAGRIYYHVLVMRPNGKLASIVMDASTGQMVSGNSAQAKAIREAARSNKSKSGAKAAAAKSKSKGKPNSKGESDKAGGKGGDKGGGKGDKGDKGGKGGGGGKK